MDKIQKMMDLLSTVNFRVLDVDDKIYLNVQIFKGQHSVEEKEFVLNWKNKEHWSTIELGKYFFDVNVCIEDFNRVINVYPVIDGETITENFICINKEPINKNDLTEVNLQQAIEILETQSDLQQAIEILETHNIWRKGEDVNVKPTDPKELTWAIETVIFKYKTRLPK